VHLYVFQEHSVSTKVHTSVQFSVVVTVMCRI